MTRHAEITSLVVAVAFVVLCAVAGIDNYLLVSVVLIACALFPLFAGFERSKPQAREVVMLAVLSALAIAARAAFMFVPHFKPMAGVVMAVGFVLGPRVGGMVGAISAFGSAFLFGLGPWTPWQMLAFSMAGAVYGFIGVPLRKRTLSLPMLAALAAGGFLYVLCVLGPTLDTCTLFTFTGRMTPETALAIYGAGVPVNAIHGAATAVTLFAVTKPLAAKLSRMQRVYGLFESPGKDRNE